MSAQRRPHPPTHGSLSKCVYEVQNEPTSSQHQRLVDKYKRSSAASGFFKNRLNVHPRCWIRSTVSVWSDPVPQSPDRVPPLGRGDAHFYCDSPHHPKQLSVTAPTSPPI
ncbi:unnamed protein product [Pleuronectes platessa]|uniref:Uncharacterized protein n=1 Tax=Pleuronectes platessa TaxID=8262 RepID=A0A9N7UJE6_PLEPL|nr:unnamed protein product [Pleuronectes platessa]